MSIHYLHNNNILHRDIKSANIFLSSWGICKLGDFGFSIAEKEKEKEDDQCLLGTPYYMAPELWNELPGNKTTDIWALGILLYEIFALDRPFNGNNLEEMKDNIINTPLCFPQNMPHNIKAYVHVYIHICTGE